MNWTSLLHCPLCQGSCSKQSGSFRCMQCKKNFPIRQGIPIFVDLENLSPHLASQVNYFEKEDQKRGKYNLEPWQARYVHEFLTHSHLPRQALIVDNATGSGYMAIELAQKGFFVVATDLTMRELIKLKQVITNLGLTKKVFLICCSSEELPLKDDIAYGMVANAILEHLPNETRAIGEITRVLKQNAILMLTMPISFRYIFPLFWPLNWLLDKRIGHLRRYTRSEIRSKFRAFNEVYNYYTGNIANVLCVMAYFMTKNLWFVRLGIHLDKYTKSIPYGASNVVSILKKL